MIGHTCTRALFSIDTLRFQCYRHSTFRYQGIPRTTYFHSDKALNAAGLHLNASACYFDDAAVEHLPYLGCAGDRLELH